ncbi:MAG: PfkB family carbohydrate kinase [Kiritimatiellia bacterium]
MQNHDMSQFRVAGVGEVLWDMLPSGRRLGGAPANFACHAAALGARGALVSAVGDDADGADILRELTEFGVDVTQVQKDARHATGLVRVSLDAVGKPTYAIELERAWDFLQWTPTLGEFLSGLQALCFGSLGRRHAVASATIARCLQSVPDWCLRVCDINLRQDFYNRQILEDSLRAADVLKINDEELPVLAGVFNLSGDEAAQMKSLLQRFDLRLLALTRGSRGSLLLDATGRDFRPADPAHVVDTVGAGDAFNAALTLGLLQGLTLAEIHRRAGRLAAYVCSQPGAVPALPAGFWER